jgi:hypothetical protein
MTTLDSYLTLGRSGLRVSPLSLGTMTFGEDDGWGARAETAEAILAEYLDCGGNVVDTANTYANGHSEKDHRRARCHAATDPSPTPQGLVQPAAAQKAAELACLRDVETKLLLVRVRPPDPALPVGDNAVHRNAHRVDQHGFRLIAPASNEIRYRVTP